MKWKEMTQQKIRQKKLEAENFLADIIRQFSNRNKNPSEILMEKTNFMILVWLIWDHVLLEQVKDLQSAMKIRMEINSILINVEISKIKW